MAIAINIIYNFDKTNSLRKVEYELPKNVQRADTADGNFSRIFNRALITLVIPIAIQNLISAAVNFTDVVMLGLINQSAMSAVSLATQVTFVLTLFYMGLSTGAGILVAQY